MWLTSSSIGRKFVMAITGVCLVLFLTFHVLMNSVALAWPAAYNQICMFLGANWYALLASIGLAVLFIIHIIYAVWLTLLNRKARGNDRYEVTSRPPQVEWSSKNMLVLGIVVVAFLVVHLIQFWARMQLAELTGCQYVAADGTTYAPEFGTLFLQAAFSLAWTPIVYIIGFVALWFHMTHGFWSMFHTVGWDNNIWIERLKCIGKWWTTIVVLLFVAQAILFTVKANNKDYLTDQKLQEQYAEFYGEKAEAAYNDFVDFCLNLNKQQGKVADEELEKKFIDYLDKTYLPTFKTISKSYEKLCTDVQMPEKLQGYMYQYNRLLQEYEVAKPQKSQTESLNEPLVDQSTPVDAQPKEAPDSGNQVNPNTPNH